MNALKLMNDDHRKIGFLFEKYRATKGAWNKEAVLIRLIEALSTHAAIESELVMLPAQKRSPTLESQVQQYFDAQKLMRTIIEGLGSVLKESRDSASREARLDAAVNALEARFGPCVDLEQTVIFPTLEELLNPGELERLVAQLCTAVARHEGAHNKGATS